MHRGFAYGFSRALFDLQAQARAAVGAPRDTDREQPAQRDEPRHDPERLMIADVAEQHRGERHDEELSERPARGDDTEGAAALFGADDAPDRAEHDDKGRRRSEEHTSELQSLMRNSYAVF